MPLASPTFRDATQGPAPVYTAFDFLSGYLTNQTYPFFIDAKPWSNGTLNVQQYQQALQGVTYWDFFSEHENWDSPSYMWQDDDGRWRPYERLALKDASGRDQTEYVLLDRKGPGAMDKLWFTQDAVWMLSTPESTKDVGPIPDMADFVEWGNLETLGHLRIKVDDRTVYDAPIRDWISGKDWGLSSALAQALTWRHREFGSSGSMLPVLYQKHLRVSVYGGSKKPKWFLATGVRFAPDIRVKSYTGTRADLPLERMEALAQNVLRPQAYLATLSGSRSFDLDLRPGTPAAIQLKGSGTLAALQLRISKSADPRQLWLTVSYNSQTAVDLPLIAFFGDQKQLTLHQSTPLGVIEDGDTYLFYSNLPMPFQRGLTLQLATNGSTPVAVAVRVATRGDTNGSQLWVDYQPVRKLAMYGPDYQIRLAGDGKLVGLVLTTEDQGLSLIPKVYAQGSSGMEDLVKRAWPMGYLEGNLTLADGAGDNRIFGGQEDWADGGFYFNRGYTSPTGGANRPFGGILRYRDGENGYATLFRYFNDLSAFRFKKGLTLSFGHGTWNNNFPVSYGSTAFYYKETGAGTGLPLPASESASAP